MGTYQYIFLLICHWLHLGIGPHPTVQVCLEIGEAKTTTKRFANCSFQSKKHICMNLIGERDYWSHLLTRTVEPMSSGTFVLGRTASRVKDGRETYWKKKKKERKTTANLFNYSFNCVLKMISVSFLKSHIVLKKSENQYILHWIP